MIYEMANAFDPATAYELKDDADFMEGMIAHLQPTITRLIHRIPIKNPLLFQTKQAYPEVLWSVYYHAACQKMKLDF